MTILDSKKFLTLCGQRKTDKSQLWSVGSSALIDTSVSESNLFSNIVAEKLGSELTLLVAKGASTDWCADQILRSDIRPGDIVLWNIGLESRFPFWHSQTNQVVHVQSQYKKFAKLEIDLSDRSVNEWLVSDHCFYSSVTHIYQVKNFCDKLGAKLLPHAQLLSISKEMVEYLRDFPNFTLMPEELLVDVAADGWHPGPAQHQQCADVLLNIIKENGWR